MPKRHEIRCQVKNSNQAFTEAPRKRVSYKTKFKEEKDLKNQAYSFILSYGLLKEFTSFSINQQGRCTQQLPGLFIIFKPIGYGTQ